MTDNHNLVTLDAGVATTTSLKVAEGTDSEHASVVRLIRDNVDDFNEFDLVRFEIRPRAIGQHGGGDVTYAVLNEEHATLLLTYMRNSPVVRDFKKRLVREFWNLRRGNTLAIPQTYAEALRAAADLSERAEVAEARVALLEPKATAWDQLADADGDYGVGHTAKILFRADIDTGERKLFAYMESIGWIFRDSRKRWCAYQKALKSEYLVQKISGTHWEPRTGREVLNHPTIRITAKGVEALHQKMSPGRELARINTPKRKGNRETDE